MEEKDLEFFKHLLTQWLEELLNRADDTSLKNCQIRRIILQTHWIRASAESDRIWTLRIRDKRKHSDQ